MFIDSGSYFNFLNRYCLMFCGVLFALLITVLSIIHYLTNRGLSIWRNFYKIQIFFVCRFSGNMNINDTKLCSVLIYDSYFFCPYPTIYSQVLAYNYLLLKFISLRNDTIYSIVISPMFSPSLFLILTVLFEISLSPIIHI